jgi:hypothetical protein
LFSRLLQNSAPCIDADRLLFNHGRRLDRFLAPTLSIAGNREKDFAMATNKPVADSARKGTLRKRSFAPGHGRTHLDQARQGNRLVHGPEEAPARRRISPAAKDKLLLYTDYLASGHLAVPDAGPANLLASQQDFAHHRRLKIIITGAQAKTRP